MIKRLIIFLAAWGLLMGSAMLLFCCGPVVIGPSSFVRLLANDSGGSSFIPLDPVLASPSDLKGSAVSSIQVDLTWTDNSIDEIGFEVERSIDQENYITIASLDADVTSYSDVAGPTNEITQNTLYSYRVRAMGEELISEYSDVAPVLTLLNEPTEFKANAITNELILLAWNNNDTQGDTFEIERSTDNLSFDLIDEIPVDDPSSGTLYEDTKDLKQDTTYFYRVRAVGADDENLSMYAYLEDGQYPTTPGPNVSFYVPDDFPTIQGAIDKAGSGDLILVRPGTYMENIDFIGKNIILQSCGGPYVTTIDGAALGSVVTFQTGETSFAVLDGFTIKNGKSSLGAGVLCLDASPTISNNIIRKNEAVTQGGGIYCSGGTPLISHNTIMDNRAAGFLSQGGGISSNASSPTIEHNRIESNRTDGNAWSQGGGIHCSGSTSPLIQGNIIKNNKAMGGVLGCFGGGIDCNGATPSILNNSILGNSAQGVTGQGGGIRCSGSPKPMIANNLIKGNTSNFYGGGIFCSDSSPYIYNNTIANNTATTKGGGIGLMFASTKPWLRNTIVWGNQAGAEPQIALVEILGEKPSPNVQFCDVEGGWNGTGNIDEDPEFLDTASGNFHLIGSSACRDSGTNAVAGDIPDIDLDSEARNSGTMDMGMDEYYSYPAGEHRVPQQFSSIQTVLDTAAADGDVLIVAPDVAFGGPYVENLNFNGLGVLIKSAEGADMTTLDGGKAGSVVIFENGEGPDAILRGFKIVNGATLTWGGGIYCNASSPTLRDNLFTGNLASIEGGGICCDNSQPTLRDNTFMGNWAGSGGAICLTSSDAALTGNYLCGNIAELGGGLFSEESAPAIVNNAFSTNESRAFGVGKGGGIYLNASSPEFRNNTVFKNMAEEAGGGLYLEKQSAPTIQNSLVWGNTAGADAQISDVEALAQVTYCDVEGGIWPGDGNISEDPKLASKMNGELLLRQDPVQEGIINPCVDTGDPASPLIDGTTRTDGVADTGIVDIGYHYPAGP
ncbi:MAG: right-handed parallel beta-helix repeat-containing protein [Planctomycetota bacterium]|jgi:hypothetical protein